MRRMHKMKPHGNICGILSDKTRTLNGSANRQRRTYRNRQLVGDTADWGDEGRKLIEVHICTAMRRTSKS